MGFAQCLEVISDFLKWLSIIWAQLHSGWHWQKSPALSVHNAFYHFPLSLLPWNKERSPAVQGHLVWSLWAFCRVSKFWVFLNAKVLVFIFLIPHKCSLKTNSFLSLTKSFCRTMWVNLKQLGKVPDVVWIAVFLHLRLLVCHVSSSSVLIPVHAITSNSDLLVLIPAGQ